MNEALIVAESVEVIVSRDGKTLWVNTEKGCVLRAQNIKRFMLLDERDKND